MADGLLDNLDVLMNRLQPSEEERRRQLRESALTFGIGALGARKGYLPQDLSRAGLLAVADYNQGLRDSGTDKLKRLAIAQQLAQWQAQQQQLQQQQELQKQAAGVFTGTGPNLAAMGPGGPTEANAAKIAPIPLADQYRKAAAIYGQAGRPDLADKYLKLAESGQKKLKDTRTLMQNGKPVTVNLYEDGSTEVVPFDPEPKLRFENLGGSVRAIDERQTQPGATFERTMSPAEVDTSKRGWAQFGLSKNADQRAAEAAKAGGEVGKWQYDATRGMRVNPAKGIAEPVMVGGEPMGGTQETKAKQSAGKVMDIVSEAEKYLGAATGSYLGAAADKAAQVFGSSTEGATAIAQLQALEGALMLNQPRMEGPQSDKDTMIYRQMAGKIGDPTVPVAQKKAALEVIKNLNKKYIGGDDFDAEYARMPSGTIFTGPDGKQRRKP